MDLTKLDQLDQDTYDGVLLHFTKKTNLETLSLVDQQMIATRMMIRMGQMAQEEGITEEEAYEAFLASGDLAEEFGDWLLTQKVEWDDKEQ